MASFTIIEQIAHEFCGDDIGRSICISAAHLERPLICVNANVPRPAASVMKVAIVMALFNLNTNGRIDLLEKVPIAALDETRYCSILKAFDQGRTLSLREVAALSLITSDNPAMVFLMSRIGLDDVRCVLNAARCSAHATCTVGFSESELGPANRANQLTAQDAVQLFQHLTEKALYAPIITFLENNLRNSRIPALLPENAVVAHKTGSLDGVVNDVGIISRGKQSFIVAFLCDKQPEPIKTQNDIAISALKLFNALIEKQF